MPKNTFPVLDALDKQYISDSIYSTNTCISINTANTQQVTFLVVYLSL